MAVHEQFRMVYRFEGIQQELVFLCTYSVDLAEIGFELLLSLMSCQWIESLCDHQQTS